VKDAARAAREPTRAPVSLEPRAEIDFESDERLAVSSSGAPAWQRDALAVSARVRALLQTLQPVVVRVLTFWDHAVRAIAVGGRRLEVDPSGCYRIR
jgi:hypothetical protein